MSVSDMIGPYEVIEQIGSGGMATVYKAYQPKLDRHVAIKVMHANFASDPQFIARFEREARIVAGLDHVNIVPLYDYDEYNNAPYLVMKYIEGQTLKDILRNKTLTLTEIRRMMRQVADGLTYAHEEGVLHRDFKPSNIIIDTQGHPYLMDFGLARIAQQGESTLSTDTMLGTPQYISPEQAQGAADLDARTDVYALGVVLYELVTGRVPFVGETAYAIVHKHIYAAPPLPSQLNPEVPPEVEYVLMRALSKDPDDRYTTPNALIDAFDEAIETAGLQALDDSRASIAIQRGESILQKTPGGGKYVSVPSPDDPNAAEYTPINEVVQQIGERFRVAFDDVKRDLEDRGVLDKIASGVRTVANEIQANVESSTSEPRIESPMAKPKRGSSRRVQVYRGDSAAHLIERDWSDEPSAVQRRIQWRRWQWRGFMIHLFVYVISISALAGAQPILQDSLNTLFNDANFIAETGADFLGPLAGFEFATVLALMWGSGLLGHLFQVFYNTGSRWMNKRRVMLAQLEAYYGPNWQDEVDSRDYKRIRKQVEERFKQRLGLMQHFIAAVMLSIAAFIAWPPVYDTITGNPNTGFPQGLLASPQTLPSLFMLLMFITAFIHAISLGISTLVGVEANARTIQREMERERELSRLSGVYQEKAKNTDTGSPKVKQDDAPRVRLTGDGEFTDSFMQELEEQEQQSR